VGGSGRQSPEVAHIPNPALPAQREPLDSGWRQAQGSPSPSFFCLLSCPGWYEQRPAPPPVEGEEWMVALSYESGGQTEAIHRQLWCP